MINDEYRGFKFSLSKELVDDMQSLYDIDVINEIKRAIALYHHGIRIDIRPDPDINHVTIHTYKS